MNLEWNGISKAMSSAQMLAVDESVEEDVVNGNASVNKQLEMEGEMKSQEDHDEEMIEMVRKCPFLFDNNRVDFKDVAKRQQAWESIGKALGQRPEVVERRWMSLRNQYSKKIREEQMRPFSGSRAQTWRRGHSMAWLKPFIKGRSHTSKTVDWVTSFLKENKIPCISLHGDMSVSQRSSAFNDFREGMAKVLSCTSVASLGLDTHWVKHVINYDFPQMMFDYVHRVGRVGRMGGAKDCRVTNFILRGAAIALTQKLEKSIRLGYGLPMVEDGARRRIRKGNER